MYLPHVTHVHCTPHVNVTCVLQGHGQQYGWSGFYLITFYLGPNVTANTSQPVNASHNLSDKRLFCSGLAQLRWLFFNLFFILFIYFFFLTLLFPVSRSRDTHAIDLHFPSQVWEVETMFCSSQSKWSGFLFIMLLVKITNTASEIDLTTSNLVVTYSLALPSHVNVTCWLLHM